PSDVLGALRAATRQRPEPIQIDGVRALRDQVRINEGKVGKLILGIVVDVLAHIRVQHLKGSSIFRTPTPSGDFAVLDAAEFVVLLPRIGFEDFCRREKPQNGRVSLYEPAPCSFSERRRATGQQAPRADGPCPSRKPPEQGSASG